VCGFVLTDPRALAVLRLGLRIAAAEAQRQGLIDEVRQDALRAAAATAFAAPAAAPAVPRAPVSQPSPPPLPGTPAHAFPAPLTHVPVPSPVGAPAHPPMPTVAPGPTGAAGAPGPVAPPAAPGPGAPPAAPRTPTPAREPRPPRRRLSVPVLLLIVGVSLVGIAAIFFMVYAWFTWGIGVRALIIGAITIATIAIASLLRRRSLTATAEAIAVLGVVLLALDAWAVRANDFFDTGSVEPALYAGVSILVIGALCRGWARIAKLRSPDIAAVLALPIGLGLVVGGVVALPAGEALVAGLLGAALGGLAHALPAPWSSARARADAVPERITLVSVGVASLVAAALVAAPVSLDSIAVPIWSGAAVVALGAAHWLLLRPRPAVEPLPGAAALAGIASGTAAAVATLLGWQLAFRSDLPVLPLLVGPVLAVAVPVLLDRAHERIPALRAARITAGILGAVSTVAAVCWWIVLAVFPASFSWVPWRTDAVTPLPAQVDGAWYAAAAGVVIAALLFLAASFDTPARRNLRVFAAAGIVLSGAAAVTIPALLVGTAALVAAAATFVLTRAALRTGAAAAATLAALLAFAAGTATPGLWLIGLTVAAAVPIAAQLLVRPAGASAAWLTLAPIGVLTAAAFLAPAALGVATGQEPTPLIAFVLLQWLALVCLVCAVVLPGPAPSRSALAVSGYALFALSLLPYAQAAFRMLEALPPVSPSPPGQLGEPVAAVVRTLALLVVVTVIALGRSRVAPVPSLGAAVLVAPIAATATFAAVQSAGLDQHEARALATVGAAVVVVWGAALRSMSAAPANAVARPTRDLVDLGALATTLALAWDVPADLRGAMLAVIAAGFAGASITRGWAAPASDHSTGVPSTRATGLPTIRAPRRLLAWPAFASGTVALWSALSARADAATLPIEAYVVAPAVGLLGFAALLVWLRRHGEAAAALTAAVVLGLAVPAVIGWTGSPVRGTVVALAASALALALTWTPLLRARIPALAGAASALLALALVAVDRAAEAPAGGSAWLLLLVAVAYVSALGTTRPAFSDARSAWYPIIVPPLALTAAAGGGLLHADRPAVLMIGLAVLAVLHLGAAVVGRAPLGAVTRWTALAGAVAFAVVGFVGGAATIDGVRIVELVSLPVALIVLTGSALAQRRLGRVGGAKGRDRTGRVARRPRTGRGPECDRTGRAAAGLADDRGRAHGSPRNRADPGRRVPGAAHPLDRGAERRSARDGRAHARPGGLRLRRSRGRRRGRGCNRGRRGDDRGRRAAGGACRPGGRCPRDRGRRSSAAARADRGAERRRGGPHGGDRHDRRGRRRGRCGTARPCPVARPGRCARGRRPARRARRDQRPADRPAACGRAVARARLLGDHRARCRVGRRHHGPPGHRRLVDRAFGGDRRRRGDVGHARVLRRRRVDLPRPSGRRAARPLRDERPHSRRRRVLAPPGAARVGARHRGRRRRGRLRHRRDRPAGREPGRSGHRRAGGRAPRARRPRAAAR
jgi:hypothetical protein